MMRSPVYQVHGLGLAFCLPSACVPSLITILAAYKRLGRGKLRLALK